MQRVFQKVISLSKNDQEDEISQIMKASEYRHWVGKNGVRVPESNWPFLQWISIVMKLMVVKK